MKISNLYITECWNFKNFQKTTVLCWWSPHTYIRYVCIKRNLLTSLPYKHSCHCIVVSSMFLHCYRDRAYSTGIHSNQRHTPDRWVPHSPLYTHSLRVSAEQGKVRYISSSYQLRLVKISLHVAEYSNRIFFPFVISKHIFKISSATNQHKKIFPYTGINPYSATQQHEILIVLLFLHSSSCHLEHIFL